MCDVKVLILEDEAITALDLKYCLQDLGYDVVDVVDTGRDAIDAASRLLPTVVLMDIKLKGDMEGTDAAKAISKLNIPVIFVTANTDVSTFEEYSSNGAFAFVPKPFDLEKLKKTINDIVGN